MQAFFSAVSRKGLVVSAVRDTMRVKKSKVQEFCKNVNELYAKSTHEISYIDEGVRRCPDICQVMPALQN